MPGNDLTRRAFMRGAGELEAGYGISAFGKEFYQHLYANLGARSVVYFNQKGTAGMYDAGFYQVQVDGELPLPNNKVIDHLYYLFNANAREDWGSEFVYNDNEVARLESYSLSFYGKKDFHAECQIVCLFRRLVYIQFLSGWRSRDCYIRKQSWYSMGT